jgi:hypothetical protein
MSMAGSKNVETNGESLKSLDVGGETSAEGAGTPGEVECQKRQRRGRDAGQLRSQFLIVIHKDYLGNLSRRKSGMIERN